MNNIWNICLYSVLYVEDNREANYIFMFFFSYLILYFLFHFAFFLLFIKNIQIYLLLFILICFFYLFIFRLNDEFMHKIKNYFGIYWAFILFVLGYVQIQLPIQFNMLLLCFFFMCWYVFIYACGIEHTNCQVYEVLFLPSFFLLFLERLKLKS